MLNLPGFFFKIREFPNAPRHDLSGDVLVINGRFN